MKPLQVVIPMAGSGERFAKAGYTDPKPLLDVAGKPLMERLLENFPREWEFVFIVREDHLRTTRFRDVLRQLAPRAKIAGIPAHKGGPVQTVLLAREAIRDDLPTIVNYCDFSFSWDAEHFLEFVERTRCDGAIVCYKGFHPHYLRDNPYAYCREEGGRVLEVREKGHFTSDRTQEYASSGTYYFSSGNRMKEYFERAMKEKLSTNGEYYVSTVYNPMIQDHQKVLIYDIPFFLQWGTPEDLEDYLYWHRVFARFASWKNEWPKEGARLMMPMAGSGSRFKSFDLPKPLVPVLGEPMYKTAQHFLPCSQKQEVLILRSEVRAAVHENSPTAKLVVLDQLTEGQADTTAQALSQVQPEEPLLISACDHGLLWDHAAWTDLLKEKPDLVVVGQRGYPGARRKPFEFSYIQAQAGGRVQQVSVKKPLTDHPEKELVLVGTFYVARAQLLREGIETLIRKDVRVNGERYLDSVASVFLERGLDVRCFEAQGYLNWGTPQTLAEFSYWHHYFQGVPA